MEFKEYKLSDLTINGKGEYGIGASAVEYNPSLYRYLRITDIDDNGFINTDELKSVNDKNAENYLLKENEIVFARTGNSTGKSYFYNGEDGPLVFAGFLIRFKLDSKKVNPKFIRYYTLSENYKGWINQFATGSTRKNINAKTYGNMIIKLPPRSYQNYIVQILDSLEEKLKENKKIITNLEELSQTLFTRWFVDFEFPDENGNPYKSSGGEMVDSELGEIPKYWSIQTLNNISESYNTKRKPLSKLEREKVASIYPYYGATKIIDYVDDYLFNGKFILVGEDGTVQTEEGHPFVQYVWGKFWVSNHAHILKGNKLSDEILMLILNNIDIEPYITGAVQPKISKKNLNSIKVITGTKLIYEKFDQYIGVYYKKIREIRDENNNLIQLRDTLLPKLMSGEIEIPDDIEVNEDELSI
ncbi:TPA: restriction endonuclease subunit S [Staphylococcus aureus]|uniref:restriction endonuclease subunit S n=1 Tax=Staphylococcus aureus TaxID=1280 RepID=UPI0032FEAC75|nr:restriction endonuclease subunit S [Staphylococcus aureus]HDE7320219.1 restriction endonuclease subunit S [Staphylococcus aureus]HDF0017276.1 restriction endonuclease subunit S [Staphylococcus aureus]HDJ3947995.1 restriction endonuclease subunit S [Staphylococcus aureus]HDJ4017551.1 restriction endonuclease subunit S [Staphylococcus aureus]